MENNTQSIETIELEALRKLNIPDGFIEEIMTMKNKKMIITLLVSTYSLGYSDCLKGVNRK